MEPNYTYYEIHTADIWSYERAVFLDGKSTEDIAREVLDKIQPVICERAKPVLGIERYNRGDAEYRRYYQRNVNTFIKSIGNLEELYRIDYFFFKDQLYQYDYDIIMNPGDRDFEFWFALKLRQYDGNIFSIADFLTYQLTKNFEGNTKDFLQLLKLTLRQYRGKLLSEKVVETVSEWIDDHKKADTEKAARRSNKEEKKPDARFHTFLLKAYERDIHYFTKNIHSFLEAFKELKSPSHHFIAENTSLEDFKTIFQNRHVPKNKRIVWIGSNKELQWFVKILNYDLRYIADLKNDIWIVTTQCFVKSNGDDFREDQLRNASGKRRDRYELLTSILSKL